jgi:quercetin dioxygenase-like cupin family protein
MDEILLAVPAVIAAVAVGAVSASGDVALVSLIPGISALVLFSAGMYGLARFRNPGQPTVETNADPYGAAGDAVRAARAAAEPSTAVAAVDEDDGGASTSRNDTTQPAVDRTQSQPVSPAGIRPLLRRAGEVEYESAEAADGMRKGDLVSEADGAPNLALRRFVLAPGASVPQHTNAVEHEQYVLDGKYTVGIGDEEYKVSAGDSLFIPAGVVHWYRNDRPDQGAFICAVPTDEDEISLIE